MLKEGSKAPDFNLEGTDGKRHKLGEFKGKYLVLYFYPRDDTAGCTIEAKGFNEYLEEFRRAGAEIVGISKDDLQSYEKFCSKHSLRFLLLADPSSKTIKKYDAYGNKGIFGMGTLRKTYLIKNGRIVKIFPRVQALGHNKEVLSAIKAQM